MMKIKRQCNGGGKKKEKGKTYSYFEQVKSVILEKETISIRTEKRKEISKRGMELHTEEEKM